MSQMYPTTKQAKEGPSSAASQALCLPGGLVSKETSELHGHAGWRAAFISPHTHMHTHTHHPSK